MTENINTHFISLTYLDFNWEIKQDIRLKSQNNLPLHYSTSIIKLVTVFEGIISSSSITVAILNLLLGKRCFQNHDCTCFCYALLDNSKISSLHLVNFFLLYLLFLEDYCTNLFPNVTLCFSNVQFSLFVHFYDFFPKYWTK